MCFGLNGSEASWSPGLVYPEGASSLLTHVCFAVELLPSVGSALGCLRQHPCVEQVGPRPSIVDEGYQLDLQQTFSLSQPELTVMTDMSALD